MPTLANLDQLLLTQRLRLQRVSLVLLVISLLVVGGTVLLTFLTVDRCGLMPGFAYWLFRAALLSLIGFGIYRLLRVWRCTVSDAAAALLIEEEIGEGSNRLVNASFFARHGDAISAPLAERLLGDMGDLWPDLRRRGPIREPALPALRLLLAAYLVMFVGLFVFDSPGTGGSLARLFLLSGPNRSPAFTTVVGVTPGNTVIKPGADLTIRATLAGPAPATVKIEVRETKKAAAILLATPVQPDGQSAGQRPDQPQWESSIKQVFQPFRYRVLADRGKSSWYSVAVAAPPSLIDWEATVTPPAYTREKGFRLNRKNFGQAVVVGSTLALRGRASGPLSGIGVAVGEAQVPVTSGVQGETFTGTFVVPDVGKAALVLHGKDGLDADFPLPLVLIPDAAPIISLKDTSEKIKMTALDKVGVGFSAEDDWGVSRVGLERLTTDGKAVDLQAEQPPGKNTPRRFDGRALLDASRLGLMPGKTVRVRLFAEDNRPGVPRRRGYSIPVEITFTEIEDKSADRKMAMANSADLLTSLIRLQQDNVLGTRRLLDTVMAGKTVAVNPIRALHGVQGQVRESARNLLTHSAALGDLAPKLTLLVETEMVQAIASLDRACQAKDNDRRPGLEESLHLEKRILAVLTGTKDSLAYEALYQDRKDLLALFRQIVGKQQKNYQETQLLAKEVPPPAPRCQALAKVQDQLAGEVTGFREQSHTIIATPMKSDDFGEKLRQVCALLDQERVFEKMVTVAETLEGGEVKGGAEKEKEILVILLKGLDILNSWNAQEVKELVGKAVDTLKDVDAALTKMEKDQTRIVEATRDLARQGKLDDQAREKLGQMDKEQEIMKELVEKLAQDLYQFPELPVCNELNSRMREVYEDVQQALDSANAPAMEIAVQKEDALLDAIKATKERVEDVEMWLPDVPDNVAWNMESFDADEFPQMPLVPLPEELEDIVGNLLDQAKDVTEQAQDSTGNNMMADGEMGWDVMDGPMPNFSAKGKSGNARPNDNEMTGRSGAGREGQSNGELVEKTVKGLEGTETKPRYTNDALQKGMTEEAEDSTLKARSTGGGKLGGVSESAGMFGKAPRRDLNMDDHGTSMKTMRQEAEALYSKARLLYLESGNLAQAVTGFQSLEKTESIPAFASMGRKVVRSLQNSQVELATGAVLAMPSELGREGAGGTSQWDFDISRIPDENYRELIRNFFRGLDNPAPP